MFVVTTVSNSSTLKDITGTIALAGAGKMGGAMLTGWLAGGLDAKRVVVIEPMPSAEINALAAQGIRLNPKDAGAVETLVIAVKPQSFREAGPALKSRVAAVDPGGLDHGRHPHEVAAGGVRRRGRARDAEHAGCDRPRHHGGGRREQCQRRAARDRRRAAPRHRLGRMGGR